MNILIIIGGIFLLTYLVIGIWARNNWVAASRKQRGDFWALEIEQKVRDQTKVHHRADQGVTLPTDTE